MLEGFEMLVALSQLSSLNHFLSQMERVPFSRAWTTPSFCGALWSLSWQQPGRILTFNAHFLISQRADAVLFPPIRCSTCCVSNIFIPCQSKGKMTEAWASSHWSWCWNAHWLRWELGQAPRKKWNVTDHWEQAKTLVPLWVVFQYFFCCIFFFFCFWLLERLRKTLNWIDSALCIRDGISSSVYTREYTEVICACIQKCSPCLLPHFFHFPPRLKRIHCMVLQGLNDISLISRFEWISLPEHLHSFICSYIGISS